MWLETVFLHSSLTAGHKLEQTGSFFEVLSLCTKHWPLESIRWGGGREIDLAGRHRCLRVGYPGDRIATQGLHATRS